VRGSASQTGPDRYVPDVTLRRTVLPLALLATLLVGLVGLPSPLGPTTADAAQPTSGQSTYVPLEPVRLLDTRTGGVRLGAGGTLDLPVVDGVRVPAGATAVVLNVTATDGTAVTDVRVFPTPADGGAGPLVNSLSVGRGATAANLVHVGIGASGSVRLRNAPAPCTSWSTCPATSWTAAPGRRTSGPPRRGCSTPAPPARRWRPGRSAPSRSAAVSAVRRPRRPPWC
jgi:hypothetical protein